jgi:hypothetical protein
LSVEVPNPDAPLSGLTPLSSGPLPLSHAAAWVWAAVILGGTLFLGFGLTALATNISKTAAPPGALVFGSASVNPAEGWTVADRTPFSVVLDNEGVLVTFTSTPAEGKTSEEIAQSLASDVREEFPQLTVSSQMSAFTTDQGSGGSLIALAGTTQTALTAAVVDSGEAVEVSSIGPTTQFGESVADIDSMLDSIRFVAADDG